MKIKKTTICAIMVCLISNQLTFGMFGKKKNRVLPQDCIITIGSKIEALPDEIFTKIFDFMPLKDIVKLNYLNKQSHKRFNSLLRNYIQLLSEEKTERAFVEIPSNYLLRIPDSSTFSQISNYLFKTILLRLLRGKPEKIGYVKDKIEILKNLSNFVKDDKKLIISGISRDKRFLSGLLDSIDEKLKKREYDIYESKCECFGYSIYCSWYSLYYVLWISCAVSMCLVYG